MESAGKYQSAVDIKMLVGLVVVFLAAIAALRVSQYSVYLLGGAMIVAVLRNRVAWAFVLLMSLVSFSIANPVFFARGFHFSFATRVLLFALFILLTFHNGNRRNAWAFSPFVWLYVYMAALMVTSLFGWAPVVSLLKAILFLVFIVVMIQSVSASARLEADVRLVRAAMLAVCCFFILGSIATIPFPAVGWSMMAGIAARGGRFVDVYQFSDRFNGITWHPQTLGAVVALLNAFLLSDALFNTRRISRLHACLMACAPVLVYMSTSRTGLIAYLVSVTASFGFFILMRGGEPEKRRQALLAAILLGLFGSAYLVSDLDRLAPIEAFLRKAEVGRFDPQTPFVDALTFSRLGLIELGFANFRQKPLIGNGFQVTEAMSGHDIGESGLIMSAPIEKGFLPIMLLEEGGIIGTLIFVVFVVAVFAAYKRVRFGCFLSTFTTFLMINSGEATFFSTSGGGGVLWMVCFCALLLDLHRYQKMREGDNGMSLRMARTET